MQIYIVWVFNSHQNFFTYGRFYFFKLISHQQEQQRSVTFMLPLNYNSVFEHTHLKLIRRKRGIVVRQIHITLSRKEGYVWRWDPGEHVDNEQPCLCFT